MSEKSHNSPCSTGKCNQSPVAPQSTWKIFWDILWCKVPPNHQEEARIQAKVDALDKAVKNYMRDLDLERYNAAIKGLNFSSDEVQVYACMQKRQTKEVALWCFIGVLLCFLFVLGIFYYVGND